VPSLSWLASMDVMGTGVLRPCYTDRVGTSARIMCSVSGAVRGLKYLRSKSLRQGSGSMMALVFGYGPYLQITFGAMTSYRPEHMMGITYAC